MNSKCFQLISEDHEKTTAARYLLNYINGEIESIKKCAECYSQAFNYPKRWFTMVCTEPHLIVWAKIVGFNYWPAKLMSIDDQQVNVRFFGDHTHADVSAKNCFLYSKKIPKASQTKTPEYRAALKVSNREKKSFIFFDKELKLKLAFISFICYFIGGKIVHQEHL